MERRVDELERFKREIDLVAYAQDHGYEIDRRRTCRTSTAMKHEESGDRILVAVNGNGHFVYSSVHDLKDQGSIVDFCQRRSGGSLGEVRKRLRPYLQGYSLRPSRAWLAAQRAPAQFDRLRAVEVDLEEVQRVYAAATPIEGVNAYLTRERCIPPEVYLHPRFAKRIRVDERGNVLFPHFESGGQINGFEIKNHRFTGFARGGAKRLFASGFAEDDERLVIAESAIDALSYAALFGIERCRFLSTAGAINAEQLGLIQAAVRKVPSGGEVVLAVDADEGGDQLVETLLVAISALNGDSVPATRHSPPDRGADWADALNTRKPSNAGGADSDAQRPRAD